MMAELVAQTEMTMTKDEIVNACDKLVTSWSSRNKKMKKWHQILSLKSEKAEENMEDVVSNDPRTAYNLALHLLTSSVISHSIPSTTQDATEVSALGDMQKIVTKQWKRIDKEYRYKGKQSWIRELVGTMLDCGWYAVLALPLQDKVIAEVWHPAEVFPEFGDDGLIAVAHVYTLQPAAAQKKAALNKWNIEGAKFTSAVKFRDYYVLTDSGYVGNGSVLDNYLVKPFTVDTKLTRVPVFTSPVSGLTDRGTLSTGDVWQENWGESIVAVNEGVNENYNDMLTFLQQILRDTATPRWFEKSTSEVPILKSENLFKRGAIFRGSPNDTIEALDMPPIPVEVQSMLMTYQNMKQRGEFPYIMYGNLQQALAGYAISQIASASLQVLTPYHNAVKGLLSDIDNFWLAAILAGNTKLEDFKVPKEFDKTAEFEIDYTIEIPGYLTQRATLARMLNPTFELSYSTIMSKLFPEILDSAREIAKARRDKALNTPEAIAVSTITSYREQARLARKLGDLKTAVLYDKAANSLESKLGGSSQPEVPARKIKQNRSVAPNEEVQATEGLGEEAAVETGETNG